MLLTLPLIFIFATVNSSLFRASVETPNDQVVSPSPSRWLASPVPAVASKIWVAEAPVLRESKIEEEDLNEPPSAFPPGLELPNSLVLPSVPAIPDRTAPAGPVGESSALLEELRRRRGPLPTEVEQGSTGEPSLITKITPGTPPQRAASLRLAEEGRTFLGSGQYEKAVERFEKAISIDSKNPYSYYYLALAHYHLAHYRQSVNFIDVAESLLSEESYWLAQVFALKGKNFDALGSFERADASYAHALKLDPNNQGAFAAITRIREIKEGL